MNVRVIYGGDSTEREVSLASGAQIAAELRAAGAEVKELIVQDAADAIAQLSGDKSPVFIGLHGGWGEDGRLQSYLEMGGIPFVGSGSKACVLAMDKGVSKALFAREGLLVPSGTLVSQFDGESSLPGIAQALARYERLVIKPNAGGSTVATTIVSEEREILPALQAVWALGDVALVEQFVPGRELTVTVWDGPLGVESMPITEIVPCSGFYDFEAKYAEAGTCYETPADLPQDLSERVGEMARLAYRTLGCRDYARVDFRLNPDGDAYILEVNTAPGATTHSLVPMAIEASGQRVCDFYAALVRRAQERCEG